MANVKKKTNSKRRVNFWRSYSFVLTLVVLVSISAVTAFAQKFSIENGSIVSDGPFGDRRWQNYSFGASSPTAVSDSQLKSAWQDFAQKTGIMSASSGGLTKAELEDSLANYIGKRISSYNFFNGGAGVESITVRDLYDAIAKNQIYSTFPLYASVSREYLGANGSPASASNKQTSISDLLNFGLLGLRSNLVGSGAYSKQFIQADGPSVTVSGSDLLHVLVDSLAILSSNDSTIDSRLGTIDKHIVIYLESVMTALTGYRRSPRPYSVTFWNSSTGEETQVSYDNIMAAITGLGQSMQNDLAKLRYVLASDEDIAIAEKQAPVKDSISNNFAGNGSAAVKPSDVDDMAGFSGSLQESLSTGANAGDVFSFIGGSGGVGFWSQAVASDLDNVPVSASDDEEDYVHFYDSSIISDYLSGGDES